ncbi:MAG: NADH-quinone oxidoreductase subunit N [Gemmatimonadota bacterium]
MMPIDMTTPGGVTLALLPELVLTGWALVVLLVVSWRHRTAADSRFVGVLSIAGYVLAVAATGWLARRGARADGLPEMIALDGFRFASDALLLWIGGAVAVLSLRWLERQGILAPEYYVLLMLATVGMMLLAGAADLITVFLGLEVMSISVYVLAGYDRTRRSSAEAALKYFLLGAFASGFLLYGIALVYGATGTFNFALIGAQLSATPPTLMAKLGLGLLLIGFGFKVALVPFHAWAPDVYEGAPTPVTAFMASGVKAAAFFALARLLAEAFPAYVELWRPIVTVMAVATILVGNLTALAQTSMKRMLAYSAVAHAGYLLLALWAHSDEGTAAVLIYLLAYSITIVAAFGILASIERAGARTVLLTDLEGLFSVRPFASLGLAVCMLSLLGFPGTFGFIGKWYLISAALAQGETFLPIMMVIGSGISIGYYLPVILAMTMKPTRTRSAHQTIRFPRPAKIAVAICVAAILVFGIWPNIPLGFATQEAVHLRQSAAPTGPR